MADLNVRTYDPKQVVIVFGPHILTGYAAGTFVNIERSGPGFEKVKGADGGVDRVNKNANDFTVTITLKQTSISNNALSALYSADILSNKGVLPLGIKDLNGQTLFAAPQAWIAEDANGEFGDDLGNREWKFETGVGAHFVGGNN